MVETFVNYRPRELWPKRVLRYDDAAEQTGAVLADATGATVRIEAALAPGATAAALIDAMAGEAGPVATVGHQPDCSEIALALLGRDHGFPVAGMAELELTA